MRLVHLYKKTEILKYLICECNNPLDYMRAAMAAIRSGLPSSIHSNPISYYFVSSIDTEQRYPLQEPSGLKISSTS
jgi:hypothetical protein